MQYKLDQFTHMWDEASLETLGSEFLMMELISSQKITKSEGSSLLDDLVFDGGQVINVPEQVVEESTYFKAPWEV